ncbi:M50 family metallopeptidase [Pseudomarimonas arenosa]|uniref:M50 family metallopeptidase n=1 Tax=Pseudomarimonas arenosa TaxID=2774145 RepID=A0AAW3ZMA9_9GAMM|nr:M50 family metallopeptidase [Pseudomarimonas arenosa]MBD8527098.1 M50 family metallopeptidase [Pseudomarimonas arenosa]
MSRLLARRQAWQAVLVALAVTVALQWIPQLALLGWPLLLGSTLAHELGHGLSALLLGGRFESLDLYADGSGVAAYRAAFGRSEIALVAAAGLLGPPLASFFLFLSGRNSRSSHIGLGVLGVLLALVAVLWAGNLLTVVFCAVLAALLLLAAFFSNARLCQVITVFMAVQLGLASFSRADYLFVESARTGQGVMLSDVGQIAAAWWLPYWVWGGLLVVLSAVLLLGGIWSFVRVLR